MTLAFLCDFDGTVAPADVGAALVARFTTAPARIGELARRWGAGEIGSRAVVEGESATLRVREGEALEFVRGFTLDPGFAPFARSARSRGEPVELASEGFGFYIRELLARAALDDLPWTANEARFENDTVTPGFPHATGAERGCRGCGNCKARHVERLRRAGHRVVLVGDGLSDRCAAEAADVVLARGRLLEWSRARGIAALPFEDFAGVERHALRLRAEIATGVPMRGPAPAYPLNPPARAEG